MRVVLDIPPLVLNQLHSVSRGFGELERKALEAIKIGAKAMTENQPEQTDMLEPTPAKKKAANSKAKATLGEIKAWCRENNIPESDGEACYHHWEGNGWTNGGKPIKCWQSTIRSWNLKGILPTQKNGTRQAAINGSTPADTHKEPSEKWRDCAKACYSKEPEYWESQGWSIQRIQSAKSFHELPINLRNEVKKHATSNRIYL